VNVTQSLRGDDHLRSDIRMRRRGMLLQISDDLCVGREPE
jgi:hypothetical protein